MPIRVAVIGAGVSGFTCAVVCAERGWPTEIFAEQIGTTSLAAAAMWYPYDAGPPERAIPWALQTYRKLEELALQPETGVSMITLRMFSRSTVIEIPEWAIPLGAARIQSGLPAAFVSGFTLEVPLTDSSVYLDYLARRFQKAGGVIHLNKRFAKFEEVDSVFDLVINCAGIGARNLANDPDLEPHRGQVVIVPGFGLSSAVVSDDAPLMYAIPRRSDCVFGGTNDMSDDESVDPATTASILDECSRVLEIKRPAVVRERVGLRPFRRTGVRLEIGELSDRRRIIHNYGHGGAGYTLSWGCAEEVLEHF